MLKGPRRGEPLSAEGLDEVTSGARTRAGLPSVVHSVDVPDGAVLSVDFLTRPWRHQEAPPGGATWR